MEEYLDAFTDSRADERVLSYYSGKELTDPFTLTRREFWAAARKAANVLKRAGVGLDDYVVHLFSENRWEDLVFRFGALMVGAEPVTINWEADTLDRIRYKIEVTGARLALIDNGTPNDNVVAATSAKVEGGVATYNVSNLPNEPAPTSKFVPPVLSCEASRFIIFTSGTTGVPKGVQLPHRAYETNRRTFEAFLEVSPGDQVTALVTNPLHHTNSTAITDWMLRRPGGQIHLLQRYTTQYWRLLRDVAQEVEAQGPTARLVAPQVARHYDFLNDLAAQGRLPVAEQELLKGLNRTDMLIGSAPVGPTTVARLQRFAGKLPHVRFGSTETCLQVMGTPMADDATRLAAFERGWNHVHNGVPTTGYYVGRPHHPHTDVKVVRSVVPDSEGFMEECAPGEPGLFVTRGRNIMSGYVQDKAATAAALINGWYCNLGDVGFYLESPEDGKKDMYWLSRNSSLLIRGGANYAYQQIEDELNGWLKTRFGLADGAVAVAVVGMRGQSEHEDDCCVVVEVPPTLSDKAEEIAEALRTETKGQVSKGALPSYVRVGAIPRNFKGAILVRDLKASWEAFFNGSK